VITRAYLVGDPEVRADQMIAGMPALLRQILSLQAAGIADIVLVGVMSTPAERDPRVHIAVRHAAEVPVQPKDEALVAVAGAVWTPAFARELVHAPIAEPPLAPVCGAGSVIVPRTAADIDAATALLMQSLYKPTDGIVSRYLNRRLSLPVSRRLLPYAVTPNHLTALATLFGVWGVIVAYGGGYLGLLGGALLLQVQSLLDGCDGEVARIKYLHSRSGEWFDQVADDVLNIAFLAGVGAALGRGGHAWAARVAAVSVVCQLVYMVALYAGLVLKADGRGSVAALRWWVDKPGPSSSATHIVGDLARRDFVCFFYLVCAVFGVIQAALVWHAVVTLVSAGVTVIGWLAFGGPEKRGRESFSKGSNGT
jgi:phosphatidylglycerophosphate synthase